MAKICDCKAVFIDDNEKEWKIDGCLCYHIWGSGKFKKLFLYFCHDEWRLDGKHYDERFGYKYSWEVYSCKFIKEQEETVNKTLKTIKTFSFINGPRCNDLFFDCELYGYDFDTIIDDPDEIDVCPYEFEPGNNYDFYLEIDRPKTEVYKEIKL